MIITSYSECSTNASLSQSQVAEKGRELKELKDTLAALVKEKEKLEGVSNSFHFLLIDFYQAKNALKTAILRPNLVWV